jgi:hypothetical protein
MQEFFNSLATAVEPELRRQHALLSNENRLSRADLLSELPWDYMRWWRLECYPREEMKHWTRLSLRIWMIFVDQRFLIASTVEWHLPFTYGDATHPRSIQEHATPVIWGNRDIALEEFAGTSQDAFLRALPPLYEARQNAIERGEPSFVSF